MLNQLRESKGLKMFSYCPHAGEFGDIEHLATALLLAEIFNKRLNRKDSPVLQYVFQVTSNVVATSPLSNDVLLCEKTGSRMGRRCGRKENVTSSS